MSKLGRWVPLAAVVVLIAAAMLAAVYSNPRIDNRPLVRPPVEAATRQPPPVNPEVAASGAPAVASSVPGWVGWVLTILGVAMVVGLLGLLVWMLLRRRFPGRSGSVEIEDDAPPTAAQTARRVRLALDQGLSDLDEDDADPRRVVIACWVRLEEAADAAGFGRGVGDTSTELVARLLASTQVSPGVLAPFAAVYREARFATHVVDASMRDQARSALTQLRDELALGVS